MYIFILATLTIHEPMHSAMTRTFLYFNSKYVEYTLLYVQNLIQYLHTAFSGIRDQIIPTKKNKVKLAPTFLIGYRVSYKQ